MILFSHILTTSNTIFAAREGRGDFSSGEQRQDSLQFDPHFAQCFKPLALGYLEKGKISCYGNSVLRKPWLHVFLQGIIL